MRITRVSAEDALASLRSGWAGLSASEAARRLTEYGPNRLESLERVPLWRRFARQFAHFFALILWAAAGLALIAEWRAPGQGMAVLGLAIVAVIAVNGVFSFWQEYRAERAMAALQRLLPHQITALRDGRSVRLAAEAWLFMLPFAAALLILEEARKLAVRSLDPCQACRREEQ